MAPARGHSQSALAFVMAMLDDHYPVVMAPAMTAVPGMIAMPTMVPMHMVAVIYHDSLSTCH